MVNMFKPIRRPRQALITVPKTEYEKLVRKAELADDAVVQLKLSLEDLRCGRVSRFGLQTP